MTVEVFDRAGNRFEVSDEKYVNAVLQAFKQPQNAPIYPVTVDGTIRGIRGADIISVEIFKS